MKRAVRRPGPVRRWVHNMLRRRPQGPVGGCAQDFGHVHRPELTPKVTPYGANARAIPGHTRKRSPLVVVPKSSKSSMRTAAAQALKATRMPPAQRLEQRQHLQPAVGIGHQLRHHFRLPHGGERVLPRPPTPRCLRRRRQRAVLPATRRPLAHSRRGRGRGQRLPGHPFLTQSPNLRVRDQPVLHEENGQSHTTLGGATNRPIASSATGKNNCR